MRLLPILLFVLLVSTIAHGDEVEMIGGDVLHGQIVEETDEYIVLMHEVLGLITIPRSGVAVLRRGNSQAEPVQPAPLATGEQMPTGPIRAKTAAVVPESPNAVKRKSHLDVGLDLSAGNTDESKLSLGFETTYTSPTMRGRLDARYYFNITDGDTTDNKFNVTATRDWLKADSKWFYFIEGTYDYDQFESWRHRVSGHGGPGYHLIRKDDLFLDLRGGIGSKNEWGSENDSLQFEGRVGLHFGWDLSERQVLRFNATVFPVLDDFSNVRTLEVISWRYRLDDQTPLSLTLRFTHEYQAIVDPGKDKHDTRLLIGLSFEF